MSLLILACAGLAVSASAHDIEQRLAAERFVDALQGKAEFQASDFERPLDSASERFLVRFQECGFRYLRQPKVSKDRDLSDLQPVPNKFTIGLDCEGVPSSTPVGITLHFIGDRISKIETHNADLMERKNG